MNWNDHILLWNKASIKLIDIRRLTVFPGEGIQTYRLPASFFLHISSGQARLWLDGSPFLSRRFHVLHGSKGMTLEIEAMNEPYEYYLVLYKAALYPPFSKETRLLMERSRPFHVLYSLEPHDPLSIYDYAVRMDRHWRQSQTLNRLYVKGLLYQFVYEIMRQLEMQSTLAFQPDIANQTAQFIKEHYKEPLDIQRLADRAGCSKSYLSRVFKKRFDVSPINYLIAIRMELATERLIQTELTIQEIAESVGYVDSYHFSRVFKNHVGSSPQSYRSGQHHHISVHHPSSGGSVSSIVPLPLYRYINNENHYRYMRRGKSHMRKNKVSKGALLLISLALLLSACSVSPGTGPSASNSTVTAEISPSPATTVGGTQTAGDTMTYHALNGDIVVPRNPQRVVVIAGAFVGHLLTLGIKPIGAASEAFNSYTEGMLDGVEDLGGEVSYEKILDLQPDLIIIWDDPGEIEKLSQIAPTVAIPYGKPVREQLIEFGKMTSREEQAQEWIANWDEKIAHYKPLIEEAIGDKTVAAFDASSRSEIFAYGQGLGRGGDILYGEFNLKAPSLIQKEAIESGTGWARLSLELLPEYAGDFIFISGYSEETSGVSVFSGELWDKLPAVRNQTVFYENEKGFIFSDPISLERQLEFIVGSLIGG
ncbi:helix-turn-helix domain-containing protein [Paenibacillus sp. CAU 1782]